MRITMQSTPALIGMSTNNAKLDMHTEHPKVEIETTQPRIEMRNEQPKVLIDQSQCFSESGLKSVFELTAENAQMASQLMYESVGRIAEQGNELANIQNKNNAIADQAEYNAYDQFKREFNLGTMPKSRPKITVVEGSTNAQYVKGTVDVKAVRGQIDMQYTPGKVDIYMKQMNQLNIQVEGSNIDLKG